MLLFLDTIIIIIIIILWFPNIFGWNTTNIPYMSWWGPFNNSVIDMFSFIFSVLLIAIDINGIKGKGSSTKRLFSLINPGNSEQAT